ncbi:thiamine phosphate synthase [candidate division KSB1 bacterium]|nr:thiamine phosphate synthase [candidate division KSB1 bacterium]
MDFLSMIKNWQLYVITDETLSKGRSHAEIARLAIEGGADVIQLRDKSASSRKLYEDALAIRKITRQANVIFIVNDRLDIALAVDADGVHVGQKDMPALVAHQLIGKNKILGVSAETVDEAVQAEKDGADYLGVGPIFEARATKPDAGEPMGLFLLRQVRQKCQVPIIAIGGINQNNAKEVIQAGADGIAVISAIVAADDVSAASRELKALVRNERKRREE